MPRYSIAEGAAVRGPDGKLATGEIELPEDVADLHPGVFTLIHEEDQGASAAVEQPAPESHE